MKKNKFLLLTFALFLSITAGNAQSINQCILKDGKNIGPDGRPCVNSIASAVPFLRITPDARSGAMGDVGIALSPDPNALHFNASKLAFAENDMGIAATYTPWLRALNLTDVYLAYLGGYRQIGTNQSVGLSLRYFSLGSIQFTDDQGAPIGNRKPYELEVAAAYARKLSERFSVSLTGKFIYSNLAAGLQLGSVEITAGTSAAADLGFTYKIPANFSNIKSNLVLGAAVTNIGTKISYTKSINKDYLPMNMGIGAAWNVDLDKYNSLTFALDVNKYLVPTPVSKNIIDAAGNTIPNPDYDANNNNVPDYKEKSIFAAALSSFGDASGSEELRELYYSFGIEYWYDKQFALRAGYYFEDPTKGARRYLTCGLGLKYNIFGLNFSYLVPTTNQRNPLDNTLRFSLLFDFAGANKVEVVPEEN